MTELDQRIALAKLRGMDGPWMQICQDMKDFMNLQNDWLPKLTLDELHEAEKCLSVKEDSQGNAQVDDYALNLLKLVAVWPENFHWGSECQADFFKIAHATVAQRSEALLRTVGMWKEDQ